MKLVIIEPLGVEEDKLMEIAHKALPDSVEIISYQTKVTDTESLIERGKDADIIMVANHLQESIILQWMPAKNRELWCAIVQDTQMQQSQILFLDF